MTSQASAASPIFPDALPEDRETVTWVQPYTMTSMERVYAVCAAARYIAQAGIAGAVVECGVWRGGSMMAVARTLQRMGDVERELFLFDTFRGMPEPGLFDVSIKGKRATEAWSAYRHINEGSSWCCASIEEVRSNLALTEYPSHRLHFVEGVVEETVPGCVPEQIALLRLDTDWYSSTRHEMEHLFPRLVRGGVLIVDDYGHWEGARRAVDEYLSERKIKLLLNRIDYTGRIAVKVFD